eukprot:484902_1
MQLDFLCRILKNAKKDAKDEPSDAKRRDALIFNIRYAIRDRMRPKFNGKKPNVIIYHLGGDFSVHYKFATHYLRRFVYCNWEYQLIVFDGAGKIVNKNQNQIGYQHWGMIGRGLTTGRGKYCRWATFRDIDY